MNHAFQNLVALGALATSLTACFPDAEKIDRRKNSAISTLVEEQGVVTRVMNPDAKITQAIVGASGSAVETAKATFPPGTINIAMKVSLEEASSIATAATVGQFDLNNSFRGAGVAVGVTSNVNADAVKPFTIALSVPTTTLHLVDPLEKLVVVYKVKVAATGEIKAGIIPRQELTVTNGFVNIETLYFGVYQAVLMESLVETRLEASVSQPLQMKREEKSLPPLEVLARQPVVVKKGDTITLSGKNFRPTMTLAWNGTTINKLKYVSDSVVSFVAPTEAAMGLTALNITQEGSESSVSMVFQGDGNTLIGSFSADQVCSDVTYFDLNGKSKQGTRNCTSTPSSTPACSSNGEMGCLTNASFKAADLSQATAVNIRSGITIAGVAGSYAPACTTDGGSACLVDGTIYKAAKLSNFNASNIATGITVAGVIGTGVGESHVNCTADGASNCIVDGSIYKAAKLSNFAAADVKIGILIAGIAGTLDNCADGDSGCYVQGPTFKAVSASSLSPGMIKSGASIGGVMGSYGPLCSLDGDSSCLVDGSLYKAAQLANFTAADIKTGISIAGLTGNATLESHVNCSADGSTGCISSVAFVAADKNFLQATNIKSGVTIGGIPGTYGPSCTADGQQNCLAIAPYKAINPSGISAWDIRKGVSVVGISGEIFFPKNMATLSTFNRDSGTAANASITVADIYDTIEDYNNNGAFPIANPTGWNQSTGGNWIMDSTNDSNSNGICDGAEACVFKDRFTGLIWSKDAGAVYTWEDAITQCNNLSYGGYTGWRLPTQKEMMQAYTNGIWGLKDTSKMSLDSYNYWTSTTSTVNTTFAIYTTVSTGLGATISKGSTERVLCVK